MLNNFSGQTFVAFIDICGFKAMMSEENKASRALDKFYQIGYNELQACRDINGIFISDCGILYVTRDTSKEEKLEILLRIVKSINLKMLDANYMLTTNIAYGDFFYQERRGFNGISKNLMMGNAYVKAFLDSQAKPKIDVGECRILKEDIEEDFFNNPHLCPRGKYFYYYWNVEDPEKIDLFKKDYKDSRYIGALQVLKDYSNRNL
jgi:hypothetical protein